VKISLIKIIIVLFSLIFAADCLFSHPNKSDNITYIRKVDPRLRPLLNLSLLKSSDYTEIQHLPGITHRKTIRTKLKINGTTEELVSMGVIIHSRIGSIATAEIPIEFFEKVARLAQVSYIESISIHTVKLDSVSSSTCVKTLRNQPIPPTGKNVLIAVYDTGLDWQHNDFIDGNKSRILFYWDQTSTTTKPPSGFHYGYEYTKADFDDELDGTPAGKVQTTDNSGHGTHVVGIAAGNGHATGNGESSGRYVGMAPEANLIIIKGGNTKFEDDKEVDGLAYAIQKAEELTMPIVFNFSLGGHQGGHDGSSLMEQAIDEAVGKGKIVVVSAGNERDKGIYAGGELNSSQTSLIFELEISGVEQDLISNNDILEINFWYGSSSSIKVNIVPPSGQTFKSVKKGTSVKWNTNQGYIEIYNASGGINPNNNANEIIIKVYDEFHNYTPANGTWKLTFSGSSGRIDGWIYNKTMEAQFKNGTAQKLVGIPGTARGAITVAAYKSKSVWESIDNNIYQSGSSNPVGALTIFSNPGPTRDLRQKPEITAPGAVVASSLSDDYDPDIRFVTKDGKHIIYSGTSQASPVVAGVIALLLQTNSTLTPDDIRSLFAQTARTDEFTGETWNPDCGYGKLDALAMYNHITTSEEKPEKTLLPETSILYPNYPNPFNPITTIPYFLVKKSQVRLFIYDITGREIIRLVECKQPNGSYTVTWNGTNSSGIPVSSGIYICHLSTKNYTTSRKMILLR